MKTRILPTVHLSLPLACALSALLSAPALSAANRYWDGGTIDIVANGNTASAGGAGTWNTTLLNWDAGAVAHVAWNNATNDTAFFGGTAAAVTLGVPITAGGLSFSHTTGTYTLQTGALTLAAGSIVRATAGGGTASLATLASADNIFRFQNAVTTNNLANNTLFTVTALPSALSGANANSVEILGNGASAASPVVLGATGQTLAYTGTTTVADKAVFGVSGSSLSLTDSSISMGVDSIIMRTGQNPTGTGGMGQTFLNKIVPTSNTFGIVSNNGGTSNALNLTNFPNASLAVWDNAGTTSFGFTGAITAGSNGYRFGSARVGNQINIGGTSGTGAVTTNILTGTAGLNLISGSLGNLALWSSNTFSGNTLNSATGKTISINSALAIQNSAIDTSGVGTYVLGTGSSGAGGNSGAAITTPTIGGLIGSKSLLTSVIATTGYNTMTSLTLNPGTGATHTYSGVIANSTAGLALAKSGAGTQILSGLNTFAGNVTVNGGTLVAAVAGSGGNSALGSVVSTRTINVNAAGTLRFDVGNVFNNNFTSTSVPTLNIAGGTVTNGGTATNSALGNVTLAGGTLDATVGSASGYGSWNLNGTVTSTGNSTFSSSASVPITLSAATGTTTTFDVQSGTLTASAALGEVTAAGDERVSGLIKIGSGTLALSGINTYTGNTVINAGALSIGSKDSLPGYNVSGRFSVASGATLAIQNAVPESDIGILLGTGNFASGSNLGFDTTAGDRTVVANLTDSANGPLGIVKVGANILTLTGTNTYTGATTVLAGALYLGSTSSLPNWNVNGGLLIASGGSLVIPNTISEAEVTTLLGTTNVAAGASLLFDTSLGNRTYNSAVTNSAQGLLNIGKIGTNTLTLTGTSTYTGSTKVSEGTLTLAAGYSGTTGSIHVSDTAGLDATLNLSGGTYAIAPGGEFRVGLAPTTPATGTVNQSGGAVSFAASGNQLLIGNAIGIGNTGNYHLSGGSITIPALANRGLMIGVNTSSFGNFVLSGSGTLNMTTASGGSGDATLMIGRFDSAADNTTTTFTQTGGTARVGTLSIGGNGATTIGGSATLTLTGGTLSANVFARLAAGNSNTATINIGGTADVTLPAFPTARGSSATATINFDGGTLRPLVPSAAYLGGLSNAFIKAGGAKIDTTNGNITITQALLTDGISLGGGLTKAGPNTLTLTGANTYTGMTTVNAGSLTVSGGGAVSASSGLTVADDATFNFLPTSVGTSLAVSTLNLNDGSSIGLACDATVCNSLAASGAATVGAGAGVGINLVGTPTVGTPYTVLTAASGLNNGSYVLLNPTDYYGSISKSPTAVTVTATTIATPLTVAYWQGGYEGFSGVWAVSNGLSGVAGLSNWTANAAGTVNTAVVPGAGTDVFLSASGAAASFQNAMTLGANMAINSLTVNDAGSPNTNPVTLLGTDGATLTLVAASGTGITVNAGSGAVTLSSNIALGSSQTWSNQSASPLTVTGTVSGGFGLIKAGTGLVNITGATAVTSTVVDAGTLYMGAQSGPSIFTTLGAASPVTLNGSSNLTIRRTNVGAVDLLGAIDGTGSLTLLGENSTTIAASDFTLNNASSFSGGTTVIGARAAPSLGSAFGSGPVTVGANGGVFVSATTQTFSNDFTIGGLGWNEPSGFLGALRLNGTTISGTITLTADTRITGAGTSTLSGKISGNFGMDFFEDTVIGTISLSGDNDYTGTTTVNSMGAGTTFPNLIVSNNTALGTTAGGTTVVGTGTTGNGSQLTLANGITVTDETLTLDATAAGYRASLITASNGTVTWDGNVVLAGTGGFVGFNTNGTSSNLTVGSSDADTITGTNSLMIRGTGAGTINSTLAMGAGGIFKTDNGIWTITSSNNGFTGITTIAAGILSISTIADSGVNSTLGAGTAIALGQNSATVGTLQLTGASGGSSNRAITLNNGASGGSGAIENTVSGQMLTLSGAITASSPTLASSLALTGAGDGLLSGGIVGSPLLALSKTGGGSWTLSGAITYRGATTVTDGTLNLNAASVFDSTTSVGKFTVNGASAVANIAGTYNVPNGNGDAFFEIKGNGTLNFSGTSTLTTVAGGGFRVGEASAGTLNVTGGSLTFVPVSGSNFIAGRTTGGNGIVNISGGTLTVTGAGGFVIANDGSTSGTVTVGGTGTLDISTAIFRIGGNATATAATFNLNTGGTFVLGTSLTTVAGSTRTFNFDGGTLKASANIAIPAILTTANVKDGGAVFDSNGNAITIDQPLLNFAGATTDSLTKKGTGTLTLTGANTYTGATTVNAGTLLVNSPGSLAATSAVTVNDNGTLGGTGTIGGNVTLAAAANLAPGASAGTLTITGALDLSALAGGAGTLAFELDALAGTNDKIVAGSLVIGSGKLGFNDFAFTNVGGLEVGTYKLITSGGLTGTLDAANLTGTIGAFSAALQLNGNDIEVVVSSANAYASWALAKGLDVSNNAKNADPDGDGRNNLAEFAYDGNPLSGINDGKVVGKVATVSGAKVLTLTLPVRTGATFAAESNDQLSALIDGIYYRIEGDGNLASFADVITEVTTGDETAIQAGLPLLSSGWTYRTFRSAGTVPPVPKAFLRAKISETP